MPCLMLLKLSDSFLIIKNVIITNSCVNLSIFTTVVVLHSETVGLLGAHIGARCRYLVVQLSAL